METYRLQVSDGSAMEERGDPRSHRVRHESWNCVRFLLGEQPTSEPLPLEAETEIWSHPDLTPRQKLEAFLRIEGVGRRGIRKIRERQDRVRERLSDFDYRRRHLSRSPVPGDRSQTRGKYYDARRRIRNNDRLRAIGLGDLDFAWWVAWTFHKNIQSLYSSKRAYITWGDGGQVNQDPDAYAKAYNRRYGGARWLDAGYRINYETNEIIIQNHRGATKLVIDLPSKKGRENITFDGLIDGDLWARRREIAGRVVLDRMKPKKIRGQEKWRLVRSGYSLWCVRGEKEGYWEHGDTIQQCHEEFERKEEIRHSRLLEEKQSAKIQRMTRLIAHACPGLQVTDVDRKSAGYCDVGAREFADRFGIDLSREYITARELREIGKTSNRMNDVSRPIECAARRVAVERVRKTENQL